MRRNGPTRPGCLAALGCRGFTLLEVLTALAVILALAGITVGTYGYVNNRGARARAEGEIAALGSACENYRLDHGNYPNNADTSSLDARLKADPAQYPAASKALYEALRGAEGAKPYFSFRPNMLGKNGSGSPAPPGAAVDFLRDPWGKAYGYSTIRQAGGSGGFNPTFDLWSTAGNKTSADAPKWVRNW